MSALLILIINLGPGTSSGAFLKIPVDPISASMGELMVHPGPQAIHDNPAMMAGQGAYFSINDWLLDLKQYYFGGCFGLGKATFGLDANYLGTDTIMGMDEKGRITEPFNYYDLTIGMGVKLGDLGADIFVYNSKNESLSVMSPALDLGYIKRIKDNQILVALNNIGLPVKFDEESFMLPTTFRLGFVRSGPVVFASEFTFSLDDPIRFKVGAEFPVSYLRFRIGYRTGGLFTGLRCGLGVNWKYYRLDYSLTPHELGLQHRFGLGVAAP